MSSISTLRKAYLLIWPIFSRTHAIIPIFLIFSKWIIEWDNSMLRLCLSLKFYKLTSLTGSKYLEILSEWKRIMITWTSWHNFYHIVLSMKKSSMSYCILIRKKSWTAQQHWRLLKTWRDKWLWSISLSSLSLSVVEIIWTYLKKQWKLKDSRLTWSKKISRWGRLCSKFSSKIRKQ